ncbi:hypothetical protein P5V15_002912 [Pogonomyrmex californicus]
MVGSAPTMVVAGNGESGFDSEREPEKRLPHPRKAAGAQITHSRHGEVVTKNNDTGLIRGPVIGMSTRNPLTRIHWRASRASSRGNSSSNSVY